MSDERKRKMDLILNNDIDDKVLSEEALKIIQEIMIDGGFVNVNGKDDYLSVSFMEGIERIPRILKNRCLLGSGLKKRALIFGVLTYWRLNGFPLPISAITNKANETEAIPYRICRIVLTDLLGKSPKDFTTAYENVNRSVHVLFKLFDALDLRLVDEGKLRELKKEMYYLENRVLDEIDFMNAEKMLELKELFKYSLRQDISDLRKNERKKDSM